MSVQRVEVVELPARLHGAAVDLWHECGLTRPWNDPDEDLRRAVRGVDSTVLACLHDDRLQGLGDDVSPVVVLGRRPDELPAQ